MFFVLHAVRCVLKKNIIKANDNFGIILICVFALIKKKKKNNIIYEGNKCFGKVLWNSSCLWTLHVQMRDLYTCTFLKYLNVTYSFIIRRYHKYSFILETKTNRVAKRKLHRERQRRRWILSIYNVIFSAYKHEI